MYGAVVGTIVGGPSKGPYTTGRVVFNVVSIVWLMLVPCAIFSSLFGLMSFSAREKSPGLIYFLALIFLLGALYLLYLVSSAYKQYKLDIEMGNMGAAKENWLALVLMGLMLLSCLAALGFAGLMGQSLYASGSSKINQIKGLNAYQNVDPSSPGIGSVLMDAGRVLFAAGSHLNLNMSMGFRDRQTYCVTPIVGPSANSSVVQASYDVWAVGMDCCNQDVQDHGPGVSATGPFRCPSQSPSASGGLRLADDAQRAFYRLAVQQAEASYNIRATHPLFFIWTEDPFDDANMLAQKTNQTFLIGLVSFFVFQIFIVVCAAFYLIKAASDTPAEQPLPLRRNR